MNNQLELEIQKLKQGNFNDYEAFYNLTCQYIYKIIKDIVIDDNATAQVVTTTYNQIYNTINTLMDDSLFYMWAGRIATEESIKFANSTGTIPMEFETVGELYAHDNIFQDQEAFIPENVLNNMEVQRVIQNTIDGLAVGYKIVLQCFYCEGMSIKEIAERLNITEEQVKYAVGYIKAMFKDIINSVPFNNNTKMYSLAQIPVFWIIFKNVLDYATMGIVGGVATGGAVAGTAAVAGGGQAAGTGAAIGGSAAGNGISAGSGMAAGNGISAGSGMAAGNGISAGSGAAAGGAVAGSGATAAGATGTGILATIGGKIALGVAATAILAVGGVAIHNAVTEDEDNDNDITTEQISNASDTDATPTDMIENTTEEITEEIPEVVYKDDAQYTFKEKSVSQNKDNVGGFQFDYLTVEGEGYEALTASVDSWNEEMILQYNDRFDTIFAQFSSGWHFYTDSYIVNRADDRVLSVEVFESSYQDEVKESVISTATFDVVTGDRLSIDDLGDVKSDIKAYVLSYINTNNLAVNLDADYESKLDAVLDGNLKWSLCGEELKVVFRIGDLGSSDASFFVVYIPYDQLPGLEDKYIGSVENYYTVLNENEVHYLDLDDNGTDEEVKAWIIKEEYGNTGFYITINGNTYSSSVTHFYVQEMYAYKVKNQGYILILSTVGDSDWRNLYFYNLTPSGVTLICEQEGGVDDFIGNYAHVSDRIHCFGSFRYTVNTMITSTGYSIIDDRYSFNVAENLADETRCPTAKQPVNVKIMQNGTLVDYVLPVGAKIYPVNTDLSETTLGFYLEDGTYGELTYELIDYTRYINGVSEHELFDNLIYVS